MNRYTGKKAVHSKFIQNVKRCVLVGYIAGNHGKSWMRSNGKLGIWYVKIPLFMTYSQTYLKMDYGNTWFALLL